MDVEEFDASLISREQLGILRERWICYITMLLDEGLAKGATVTKNIIGENNAVYQCRISKYRSI